MDKVQNSMFFLFILMYIVGFGCVAKKNLFRWILYKIYVFAVLAFILYKTIHLTDYVLTSVNISVVVLLNQINYHSTRGGVSILLLETFFSFKSFNVIFENFRKIDEILLVEFQVPLSYRKIKLLTNFVTVIILIELVAISQVHTTLFWGDVIAKCHSHGINLSISGTFIVLAGNLMYRVLLLKKVKTNFSLRELELSCMILQHLKAIVGEMNRYFKLKMLYLSSRIFYINIFLKFPIQPKTIFYCS